MAKTLHQISLCPTRRRDGVQCFLERPSAERTGFPPASPTSPTIADSGIPIKQGGFGQASRTGLQQTATRLQLRCSGGVPTNGPEAVRAPCPGGRQQGPGRAVWQPGTDPGPEGPPAAAPAAPAGTARRNASPAPPPALCRTPAARGSACGPRSPGAEGGPGADRARRGKAGPRRGRWRRSPACPGGRCRRRLRGPAAGPDAPGQPRRWRPAGGGPAAPARASGGAGPAAGAEPRRGQPGGAEPGPYPLPPLRPPALHRPLLLLRFRGGCVWGWGRPRGSSVSPEPGGVGLCPVAGLAAAFRGVRALPRPRRPELSRHN